MASSVAFVQLPSSGGTPVGGFVLNFESVTALDEFFAAVEDYFTAQGGATGSLHVELKGNGVDPADFMFRVLSQRFAAEFSVSAANADLPSLLRDAMDQQPYYFVIGSARPIHELTWIDVEDRYLYRAVASVNGELLVSVPGTSRWTDVDPVKTYFQSLPTT